MALTSTRGNEPGAVPAVNISATPIRWRHPQLSPAGQVMLDWLQAHPHAPLFRNQTGARLSACARQRCFWRGALLWHLPVPPPARPDRGPPQWLQLWARRQWPRLSARIAQHARYPGFEQISTSSRADLGAHLLQHSHLAALQDLREPLICFSTSGTTGHRLRVPSLPSVAAEYRLYHQRALRAFDLRLKAGSGAVGVVLAGYQQHCFTYASVNPLQGDCGVVKLNLMPHEWRHPSDRAAYLDALAPELISGDPVSLAALAELPFQHRPLALMSTSMTLSLGLRQRLVARFGCPVLDIYSMNEAGPIAVYLPEVDGFLPLQPGLYIELLDEAGNVVPMGQRGEITLSGGFNPLLPLLRYRTGDHACWALSQRGWVLQALQGRGPVLFHHCAGHQVNNVDITRALQALPLRRFALHQQADKALRLSLDPLLVGSDLRCALDELAGCLGPWPVQVLGLTADDKVQQYSRAAPPCDNDDFP